jgi:nitronate monooxygenase
MEDRMNYSRRFTEMFGVALPIIQAPMAGASGVELAIAVAEAGGLGSLPCAMLTPEQVRVSFAAIRQRTAKPVNLNFFCHKPAPPDENRERRWRERLASYYVEFATDSGGPFNVANRAPFDGAMCDVVAELKPEVLSFHFGLPGRV